MTCEEAKKLIPGLVGDEPETGEAAEEALAHVRVCADCARELERYRFHFENLRSTKYAPGAEGNALEGFLDGVMAGIASTKTQAAESEPVEARLPERRQVSDRVIRVRKSAFHRLNWGLAFRMTTTAALVAVVITLFIVHIGRNRSAISPDMANINVPEIRPPIIENWNPSQTANIEVILGGSDETADWETMPAETGRTLNKVKNLKRENIAFEPVDQLVERLLELVHQAKLAKDNSKPGSRQAKPYSPEDTLDF